MIIFNERFLNVLILQKQNGIYSILCTDDQGKSSLLLEVLTHIVKIRHRQTKYLFDRIALDDLLARRQHTFDDGVCRLNLCVPLVIHLHQLPSQSPAIDLEEQPGIRRLLRLGIVEIDHPDLIFSIVHQRARREWDLLRLSISPQVKRIDRYIEFEDKNREFISRTGRIRDMELKLEVHFIRFALDRLAFTLLVYGSCPLFYGCCAEE